MSFRRIVEQVRQPRRGSGHSAQGLRQIGRLRCIAASQKVRLAPASQPSGREHCTDLSAAEHLHLDRPDQCCGIRLGAFVKVDRGACPCRFQLLGVAVAEQAVRGAAFGRLRIERGEALPQEPQRRLTTAVHFGTLRADDPASNELRSAASGGTRRAAACPTAHAGKLLRLRAGLPDSTAGSRHP
jgi:hypothetical protein